MATQRAGRRLVAILAADIVGYSRLVERDEAGTLGTIKVLRETAIDPLLAEHQGRIVKLMGDGAIVEFGSVVDAVACAVAVQKAVAENQGNTPAERRIVFRMGVNLGDVVVDGEDLLGDGVNVAARLEQLCEPGGILISGTAFDHLQGRLGLPLEFTGEQKVKNISRPVRAYRVRLDGKSVRRAWPRVGRRATVAAAAAGVLLFGVIAGWWWAAPPQTTPAGPSIAVLPFDNRTGDERIGRLADGMVGDLITELSRAGMSVVGRGTSFGYRDKPHDARTVGQELGVRYVLEGALDGDGQRIRAVVGLVDTVSGTEVWSERYDRPLNDLFAVQDELTAQIANSLGRPTGAIRTALTQAAGAKPEESLQAFDLMLLGRAALFRFSEDDNRHAEELLQRATQLDPGLARAFMNLAGVYEQRVDHDWGPRDEAMADWEAAARKAVELAPENGWSRFELAGWYLRAGNLPAFANEIGRAADLAQDSQLMFLVASILPRVGQSQRGLDLIGRARQLDPAAIDRFSWVLQQLEFFNRRFEEGAAAAESLSEPDIVDLLYSTLIYAQLGRPADMERWRTQLLAEEPDLSDELIRWSKAEGVFVLPQAASEATLWRDNLAKAGIPRCATSEQLDRIGMTPLPECDAERATRRAAAP